MEPSSSDLRYFLETVRLKSISGASSSLGISQPSLSLAIQRIEKFLGEQILIRSRRGAIPTTAGRALMANAKRLIDVWDEVRLKVRGAETELSGRVVLGFHPEVAIDSAPLFMPDILESYPKLEITLVHGHSRRITEQVIACEVDIGIVVNPKRHPDLVIRKLSSDEVNFWVGPGKRSIQLLNSGKAVLFCDTELAQSQILMKRAEKRGIRFSRIIHTNDLELVTALTAGGAGIGILPSEVALRYTSLGLMPVAGIQGLKDTVALITRYENRHTRSVEVIASAILVGHQLKYGTRSDS